MLFPYTYVPHQMEKMQEFIDFIFQEVWCKAPTSGAFSLDLFFGNAELKEVMTSFFYDHTQAGDFFYGHVERIYGLFSILTPAQINQLQQWYLANNDIEKACANNPAAQLVRYADILPIFKELSEQLQPFFKGLYWQQLLGVAALKTKIGEIDDHYDNFMGANKIGKCPFCGLSDIKGVHNTKREAYDHYLPKAIYPFNTTNFRNLAPACHECNSTYKLAKDPINTAAGRRKSFYPYANPGNSIEVTIDLTSLDIDHLAPDAIRLAFGPLELNEEIETWKDVYGIEERYKAKCCSESDGKYWLTQVLDEWREEGRSPAEFINTLNRQATRNPYSEANFLKKAFLDGCERAGVFEP